MLQTISKLKIREVDSDSFKSYSENKGNNVEDECSDNK